MVTCRPFRSEVLAKLVPSCASEPPRHSIARISDLPRSDSGQDLPDITGDPGDQPYSVPADLVLHATADSAADQQLDRQLPKASGPGKAGKHGPVFVSQQFFSTLILQKNQYASAAVEYRRYSELMLWNGYSHDSTGRSLSKLCAKNDEACNWLI